MTRKMISQDPIAVATEPTTGNRTGTWRFERPVFVDRLAPCSETCPVGVDIPMIMALNSRGDFENAYYKIREENPFPGICGRVCYAPCETVCNRRRFDEAVSVRDLEWFVTNLAWERDVSQDRPGGSSSPKVAVVGGTVAGLSCAYFLACLGHRVTILEREARLEGIFRLVRAEDGLPRDFLEWEVEQVLNLGIDIRFNSTLGQDVYQELGREFEAIYVSPGALDIGIDFVPKEATLGVYRAQDLLRRIKSNNAPALFGQVVIVGGGTRALETARAVKEFGVQPIIVYSGTCKDAHAIADEVVRAEKEGIQFLFQTGVLGLIEESRRVRGLICSKMESGASYEAGEQGIPPSVGAPFEIDVDQVIIALGPKGNLSFVPVSIQKSGLAVIDANRIPIASAWLSEKRASDQSRTTVREIASGKGAALSLDMYFHHIPFDVVERFAIGRLEGLSMEAYRSEPADLAVRRLDQVVRFEDLNLAYFRKSSRIIPSPPTNTFTKRQALISGKRCFHCGICTFCYKCHDFCPDLAIRMLADSRLREIDYDHCKGCGICAEECPRGAISWTRE